jgi:hypothetical protein
MVNANKKGREAENRTATFLRVRGWDCELVRLAGLEDRGDIWVPPAHTEIAKRLEVKNHASIVTALNEAMKDVVKLNALFPHEECWGVVARPGKSVAEWYAVRQMKDVFRDHVGDSFNG